MPMKKKSSLREYATRFSYRKEDCVYPSKYFKVKNTLIELAIDKHSQHSEDVKLF